MLAKVLVLPGAGSNAVRNMFATNGYDLASDLEEADIVCFTGGEDVHPAMYGEHVHKTTSFNQRRDDKEASIYYFCVNMGIPMVGICRGGQFLNVMNGGKLYQDVDNHAISGVHDAFIYDSVEPVKVTSTHHQMMKANPYTDHKVLMFARLSTTKASMSTLPTTIMECVTYCKPDGGKSEDLESVFYPGTRSLCFQPHPENFNAGDTERVFFKFMDEFLIMK